MTSLEVSLGLWQDRPANEVLQTATIADSLGYSRLWIGEMATYDSFALATAVGLTTQQIPLTVGPFAVTVRDPAMIAMGAASVADLTGRNVEVALGTSSPVVVSQWHGRSLERPAAALAASAAAVRELLDGKKAVADGPGVRTAGYRLRLPAPHCPLVVAAFGPAAVRVAAATADRMVVNLVGPRTAGSLASAYREAGGTGRVAAWVCTAVDPGPAALEQLRRGLVGYLGAPGYAEMFRAEGFGTVVDFAATRPHPRELLAAIPPEMVAAVGFIGSVKEIRTRMDEYREAGVDDLVIVPSATDENPAGERTLRALV